MVIKRWLKIPCKKFNALYILLFKTIIFIIGFIVITRYSSEHKLLVDNHNRFGAETVKN